MKKIHLRVCRLILLLLIWHSSLTANLSFSMEEETTEKEYDLKTGEKVQLKNSSGNIRIDTWDKDRARIIVTRIGEKKEDLKNATIEIEPSENALWISARQKKKLGMFQSSYIFIHFRLTVPKKTFIEIESANGNTSVEGIEEFIEVTSVCGDVSVNRVTGGLKVKSISGNITIGDVSGDVDIKTTSGTISMWNVKGSLDAENVSGAIDLKDVSGLKNAEIDSISGKITLTGPLNPVGFYEINSHCGQITLKIPEETGFELQTRTFSGKLRNDFNIKNIGKSGSQKYHGISGNGGSRLMLSSFSSDMCIEKY